MKNFIKKTYGSVEVDLKKRPLSYSSLKEFRKSPIHYLHYISQPKKESDAFTFGSLLDCLVFMPETYVDRFLEMPEINRRTNEGKEEYKSLCELAAKKKMTLITPDQLEEASTMADVLHNHKLTNGLLERCDEVQADFQWTDKETELPMRAVLDTYHKTKSGIVIDLKSSVDADDKFQRVAYDYNYFLQTAIYLEALRVRGQFPESFYNIVIEKSAPYAIGVWKASDDYIKAGHNELRRLLLEFKMCLEQKRFTEMYEFKSIVGYHTLDLPGYAKQKLEE